MAGLCVKSDTCLCGKDLVEYWLLHSIRSVCSQLRSDFKAGSKFVQTKTMVCVGYAVCLFCVCVSSPRLVLYVGTALNIKRFVVCFT